MSTVVFFLEEPSTEEMLKGLLPRVLPEGVFYRCLVFEGKQDLERQLVRRMRGWKQPRTHFVVVRDQDSAHCREVKDNLLRLCSNAGRPDALVRIACHELESWYLGDLAAVEAAFRLNGLARKQNTRKYREPDSLANASQELKNLTKHKYQKISGSRAIGPHLSLDANRSHSFRVFLSGILRITVS